MEVSKFKTLSKKAKYDQVGEYGNHIAKRFYQSYEIHLYKVHEFLVEVWWKAGLNQIYWIEAVDNQRFELYMKHVKLNLDD